MIKITNLAEENLLSIASNLNGKLWIKAEKIRIYVTGGNNYHYDGKWWYEISEDGSWEAKCWISSGYSNSKREEYVQKHLLKMEERMEEAINEGQDQENSPYICEPANFGDNEYNYPANFYNGCGSYYLAFDDSGKLIASVNFSSDMGEVSKKQKAFFESQLADRVIVPAKIIEADGSGVTFFARRKEDLKELPITYNTYYVPDARGGEHRNIELILQ